MVITFVFECYYSRGSHNKKSVGNSVMGAHVNWYSALKPFNC